jgi:hypothetical protein
MSCLLNPPFGPDFLFSNGLSGLPSEQAHAWCLTRFQGELRAQDSLLSLVTLAQSCDELFSIFVAPVILRGRWHLSVLLPSSIILEAKNVRIM